jgi:hypothetical protein
VTDPQTAWCGACQEYVLLPPNVIRVKGRTATFQYPCCQRQFSMLLSMRYARALRRLSDQFVEDEVSHLRGLLDRPDAVAKWLAHG